MTEDSTKENGSDFGSILGSPVKSPTKGIRRKRRKGDQLNSDYHHTFVMKLFDKSVDLAQFPASTSLYPVCRYDIIILVSPATLLVKYNRHRVCQQ